MTTIEGETAAGLERVREAFVANFERHGDIGAAVCVYHHGRPVVDLWAGSPTPGPAVRGRGTPCNWSTRRPRG